MYLSIIDEELGYATIPNRYINWDLFEDDDCDERTIYQIEGIHYTIAHDIHDKAYAEIICKVPQMMWELKRCYEELDRPKVTIDDWDKAGPCVTVYLEGKEYVGILREYNASE